MTLTADITALTVDMTLTVDIALTIDNRHEFTEKNLTIDIMTLTGDITVTKCTYFEVDSDQKC